MACAHLTSIASPIRLSNAVNACLQNGSSLYKGCVAWVHRLENEGVWEPLRRAPEERACAGDSIFRECVHQLCNPIMEMGLQKHSHTVHYIRRWIFVIM